MESNQSDVTTFVQQKKKIICVSILTMTLDDISFDRLVDYSTHT